MNLLRVLLVLVFCALIESRRHKITITDDDRKLITCTTFGFLQHSHLGVQMSGLKLPSLEIDAYSFGFSLDKSDSARLSTYFENKRDRCALRDEISAMYATAGGASDRLPSSDRDQVALVLLRFDLQNPTENYKASRIMLSTTGRRDLSDLALFPIKEGEYYDWTLDPLRVPPSFQLGNSESRYKVYATMWKRFFLKQMPRLLASASQKCSNQFINGAINGSLAEVFSALLADAKVTESVTHTYSYLPTSRDPLDFNELDSNPDKLANSGTLKAGKTNGRDNTFTSVLTSLEDFKSWFVRVLEQLRATHAIKSSKSTYYLNGAPLNQKTLGQLLSCVATAVDQDKHKSLRAFGYPAGREMQSAVFDTFRISASNGSLPLTYDAAKGLFSADFVVAVEKPVEEGLYTLYFHNCPPREPAGAGAASEQRSPSASSRVTFELLIVEKNAGTFLSATEIALPLLNYAFVFPYALLSVIWCSIICRPFSSAAATVYKIHYLMLLLLVLKALTFVFHGMNYHVLGKSGQIEEAWAMLYYLTYLVKGALLFMTVALIGAGWAFVKHVLSERDKKVIIIVIPLQVVANVAKIVIAESEESMQSYAMLKDVLTLLDLVCCGAILFPIVWSIRHLQQAAQTNGKAALILEKLRLFQQFYLIVVGYIMFTRIMASLLRIAVSFRYDWVDELFSELATLVFFVISGYKFRPRSNNPYLSLPTVGDDDDDEEANRDANVYASGAFENVQQTRRSFAKHERQAHQHQHQLYEEAEKAERSLLEHARHTGALDDDDVVWDTRILPARDHLILKSAEKHKHRILHSENYE